MRLSEHGSPLETHARKIATIPSHRQRIWGLCYRMTGDRFAADDLAQEWATRAIERASQASEETFERWLYRSSTRSSSPKLRSRARRRANHPCCAARSGSRSSMRRCGLTLRRGIDHPAMKRSCSRDSRLPLAPARRRPPLGVGLRPPLPGAPPRGEEVVVILWRTLVPRQDLELARSAFDAESTPEAGGAR